jgi:hypothetical protein
MQVNHSWMDSPRHVISGDRWFLTAEELWPCEVISPKEWLRNP